MAVVFIEGFAKHGPALPSAGNLGRGGTTMDMANQSFLKDWTSMSIGNGQIGIVQGAQGGNSKALKFFYSNLSTASVGRALPQNYSRLIVGFRMNMSGSSQSNSASSVYFQDAGGNQCLISLDQNGRITFWRGNNSTNLYTSAPLALASTWHYFEVDVTFHGSAGAFQIWLDGVSLVHLTGQNTIGTGNAYANAVLFLSYSCQTLYQDIYLFDATGTTNNAARGDSVVQTLLPTADTAQKNFTPTAYAVGPSMRGTSTTNTPGANQIMVVPFRPEVNCTLASVGFTPNTASTTAKMKGVVYSDASGAPGSLLSDGTEVTATVVGTPAVLPLVTPQALTGGTQYWIGFYSDTSLNLLVSEDVNNVGQRKANTYTSGAPAGPLTAMTTAQNTWQMWGVATGAVSNYALGDQQPGALVGSLFDTVGFVQSGNVNDEDLYAMSDLTGNPASIGCVQVTALASKDAAGTRTVDLRLKSGATESSGSKSGFGVGTSPQQILTVFETDPATSAAWTVAAVNALTAGFKVTA